jgi:acetyltransferase-like isoleucine patch superfamily enzyme
MKIPIRKIWKELFWIRSILSTIYFNFHYLPLKQAVKLPILLYKPKLLQMKGKVIITGNIRTGMICLGKFVVSFFPDSGIVWENCGGICEFNGSCLIGNSSTVSIGSQGKISFGNKFLATAALKIASYKEVIKFGNDVLIGWDNIIIDTDFHKIYDETGLLTNPSKAIKIGNKVWIGCRCVILKGGAVADGNIIAANTTVLQSKFTIENAIIGGNPTRVLKTDIQWNL